MTHEEKLKYISIDPAFGILTRPALELELSQTPRFRVMNFYVMDLKDIHHLNRHLGYCMVNTKIRSILRKIKLRYPSIIMGRAFSGDELVFVYPQEEWFFIRSIIPFFEREKIGFKYVSSEDHLGNSTTYYRKLIDKLLVTLGRKQYFHAI